MPTKGRPRLVDQGSTVGVLAGECPDDTESHGSELRLDFGRPEEAYPRFTPRFGRRARRSGNPQLIRRQVFERNDYIEHDFGGSCVAGNQGQRGHRSALRNVLGDTEPGEESRLRRQHASRRKFGLEILGREIDRYIVDAWCSEAECAEFDLASISGCQDGRSQNTSLSRRRSVHEARMYPGQRPARRFAERRDQAPPAFDPRRDGDEGRNRRSRAAGLTNSAFPVVP